MRDQVCAPGLRGLRYVDIIPLLGCLLKPTRNHKWTQWLKPVCPCGSLEWFSSTVACWHVLFFFFGGWIITGWIATRHRACYHRLFGPRATGYNLFPLGKKQRKKSFFLGERLMIKRVAGLIINVSFGGAWARSGAIPSSQRWQAELALPALLLPLSPLNPSFSFPTIRVPVFFFFLLPW